MITKQVAVTKYVACDDQEFDTHADCESHEREVRCLLEHEVKRLLGEMRELKYAINEARIRAQIELLHAQKLKPEARSARDKSQYCTLMSNYWHHTSEYNVKRCELYRVRRMMSMTIDNLYQWFGHHRKKSSVARLERRRRSCAWRQENTPDKWRTPNKILVNKLPKEEQQ